MTSAVHLETIDGSFIVLDYDGEIYHEVKNKRYAIWPSTEQVREIKAWAENRIDHAEKPLREARDKWADEIYDMPYSHLAFGEQRDIVDKIIAKTTDLLNN